MSYAYFTQRTYIKRQMRWSFISASYKGFIVSSVGPPHICGSKLKPLTITGFKGNERNGDSEAKGKESKVCKTSVRVDEKWEVKSESPKTRNVPLNGANESLAASSGIQKLFKKWLTMLHSPTSNQGVEETLGEPPPENLSKTSQGMQQTENSQMLKVVWSTFQSLDATIKIPLLILWVWKLIHFFILPMLSGYPYITYVHYNWDTGKERWHMFSPYCGICILCLWGVRVNKPSASCMFDFNSRQLGFNCWSKF